MPDLTTKDIGSLEWMTLREVANEMNCSAEHARQLCIGGSLKSANIGTGEKRRYRVKRRWLDDFLREHGHRPVLSVRASSGKHQFRHGANPLWA